ncbi:hypothetical protein D1007_33567 [Hordeum vulgare]|nr:hypothetical protein D1007_33567 [Hordeum vulgare]
MHAWRHAPATLPCFCFCWHSSPPPWRRLLRLQLLQLPGVRRQGDHGRRRGGHKLLHAGAGTFLFDAQLFPEFNQSEGFVLLSRPVALWRVAADVNAVREEASFNTSFTADLEDGGSVSFVVLLDSFPPLNIRNDKHGPRWDTNGTAVPVDDAAVPNATNGIATVEVGSLAVRIEYNAAAHRLSVYAHDTAAKDSTVNDTAALLLDAPLDLADRLPAQAALVGFYASTVRDLVVGVHDWELAVDSLADGDVVGDGPRRHSTSSSSSWLVILLAVLGSVAAVAAVVVSVMVYLVVARRRAVDMEVQQCYRDYFARMTRVMERPAALLRFG